LDLVEELGFPIQALIAGAENMYRKPNTEMWDYMVTNLNGAVEPDPKISFYCGDAAGRVKNWKKNAKKDFSCGDRKFAANVGVLFHTPEALFLEETDDVEFDWECVDPASLCKAEKDKKTTEYHTKEQEMIVMVGCPASGKRWYSEIFDFCFLNSKPF